MIILIPMGGEGSRFKNAGYKENKTNILVTDRFTGKKTPMILAAMNDIPAITNTENKIICINRKYHEEDGTEALIKDSYPNSLFIHDHVLLDQAYGCFLAREFLQTDEELFIGCCDNGMDIDNDKFEEAKKTADVIMISHTNDHNIEKDPYAHSWVKLKNGSSSLIESISLKKPVSSNPMNDHATTGMFWFRSANIFLKYLEEMIWNKDTLNSKYYVDKVLQYCINANLNVHIFDVNFICWGTPYDYELYEKTINYWSGFIKNE